jgi:hypothetical protein
MFLGKYWDSSTNFPRIIFLNQTLDGRKPNARANIKQVTHVCMLTLSVGSTAVLISKKRLWRPLPTYKAVNSQ